MTHETFLNELWQAALTRLGGASAIEASARELGAFPRARAVRSAAGLLRLILACCLGGMGLKTIIGLQAPPGEDAAVAKIWILAHLLMVLLIEPQLSAPEVSPRLAA